MITNQQVRKLRLLDGQGIAKEVSAARVGMDAKTARKYRRLGKLPSEVRIMDRNWRTHPDLFAEVWPELEAKLQVNPQLQAKTLFADLQRRFPGRFAAGQLRTLQRRVKTWRAEGGPAKEVFFAQVHHPGRLAASDFTHCTDLGVTINGSPFVHLIYHFVLTYSNWETGTICFSESLESLSEGLQNALWELGGVPQLHRTDRLTAAVQPGVEGPESFKQRYQALLSHYGLQGQAIQAGKGNENGDAEQSHNQFKRALDQALMMRGSRDFTSRDCYWVFVRQVFEQQNAGRAARLAEEVVLLRPLPSYRLEACKRLRVRVEKGSIIKVQNNVYSVASRLIGEWVEARLYAEHIEVWYAQKLREQMPRLRGRGKHDVHYRHVIDWLVRKPGAFADYRYREDLFPSSHFRMAYDVLRKRQPARADKEYLRILHLAARESEAGVEAVLVELLKEDGRMDAAAVAEKLRQHGQARQVTEVTVAVVDLRLYDALLEGKEAFDGEGQGQQGEAGGVSEGTAPASLPEQLRGAGATGSTGGAELRAVPAGSGPTGVPGAAEQAC
jgi:Mu transposase-like protein